MGRILKRILYAEDEFDIQEIAKLALVTVGGFDLKVCSSRQEAVESATEFDPGLILLDVMMPGMDGPTTLRELRKIPGMESVPVCFMTAKVLPQEVEQYKKMGAIDVISKPFDPLTFAEIVNEIWRKITD